MSLPELLAPAGSPECVIAAVQNGADAIYLGLDQLNCRRGATNFTEDDLYRAADYCHIRGVRLYLTLNTLVTDRELPQAEQLLRPALQAPVDALLIQDWGLAALCHQVAPSLPLHASTQMGLADLDGVREAARLGCTRAVLAREVSGSELRLIAAESPIELEVFVHGALCMCYSGQCFLSAVLGRRSGNRGLCAQPCRLPYQLGHAKGGLLSLRDLSLAQHLEELCRLGIASLKIEGRMKRPEYVAAVTRIFRTALDEKRVPTAEETALLQDAFSRQGFTDGYWAERRDRSMFGVREEPDPVRSAALYRKVRPSYASGAERPRVPLSVSFSLPQNAPSTITVADDCHRLTITGPVPQQAIHRPLTEQEVAQRLSRTGGTPYQVREIQGQVAPGVTLPAAALNQLRRQALDLITQARLNVSRQAPRASSPVPPAPGRSVSPALSVQVSSLRQITPALLEEAPSRLILPLEAAAENPDQVRSLAETGLPLCVAVPRFASMGPERDQLRRLLAQVRALGVTQALIGTPGGLSPAEEAGFTLHGDFGLGVLNSRTLYQLLHRGLSSATVSFELSFPQIRALEKPLPTGALLYGRLPLMLFRNCLFQSHLDRCGCQNGLSLKDRRRESFPILREFGCRNLLLNGKPLYLADKREDWSQLGLWEGRLFFTTETSEDCVRIFRGYRAGEAPPVAFTRGLYYRGVE